MRVGIWAAYGKTLTTNDGIGVFAHLLARNLAHSARVETIALAIHAGDEPLMSETVAAGEGRIRTVALQKLPFFRRWRRKRLRRQHRRLAGRLQAVSATDGERGRYLLAELAANEAATASLLAEQPASDPAVFAGNGPGGCDVWMLPHVSVERGFASASVVMIHDMVPLREPGIIKPHDLASFRRRSQAAAARATLIGCMSQVIRDEDIVGLLGCPAEQIRVVRPAVPDDLGSVAGHADGLGRQPSDALRPADGPRDPLPLPAGVRPPYVLYPAAFRPYKNHHLLIEALPQLARLGHDDLQLVFTGGDELPGDLQRLAASLGVMERVRAIGRVDRLTLARLYREAVGTVVPSRHEQGSFPILEALACGCPVATADIPSLREAFEPLGEAMLFFSPDAPSAAVEVIVRMIAHREAVRAAQSEGFTRLRRRTWREATEEWIDVFEEAIERHARRGRTA